MALTLLAWLWPALLVSAQQVSVDDLYRQGLILLKQNDTPGALRALETAARQMPEATLVWLALAEARLRAGDLSSALAAEHTAARLAPSDPVVLRARAMFHSRVAGLSSDRQQIAQHFQQAIQLDPQREAYPVAYGRFLLDNRAEKQAEAMLRASLRLFPRSPDLHRLLGLALYAQGQNEATLDAFLQAIDLAPQDDALHASLETLLPPPQSRVEAVRQRLERYRSAYPNQPVAPYLLALCGGPDVELLLRKAVTLDPRFWPALFELHKIHQQRGEIKEVIRLLERVVELNSEYAPAYYALGQAYAATGDREAARRARARHHELSSSATGK